MTPLSFAAIGARRLADSLAFYRDVIGLDVVATGPAGPEACALLGLPADPPVQTALLAACGDEVGRLLLIDTGAAGRRAIRQPGDRTTRGLWNINFYVDDLRAKTRELRRDGFAVWADPAEYEVGPTDGRVIEMVFDAPDGVAINLVQPLGGEGTAAGRLRAEIDRAGRTRTGFTPIATTANCVPAMATALPFYQGLLGSEIVIDAELGKPETNRFLRRPPDARSRTVFLGGGSPYGKLALNEPLNYAVPDRVTGVDPGDIGYFAQGFVVADVAAAARRAVSLGGSVARADRRMDLPGFDGERTALVRAPDRGALVWLVEGGA